MSESSGSARKPLVSVLTPTIPGREQWLRECEVSVAAQTWLGVEHRIVVDGNQAGFATTMNQLAADANGEWILPLCDDDLLLPGAVATLLSHSENADVVYAPPLVSGNEDRWWFFQSPPVIPATALIRHDLFETLGGYDTMLWHEEDRDLWLRALEADATFVRVEEPCWVYRQHSAQKSFNKVTA